MYALLQETFNFFEVQLERYFIFRKKNVEYDMYTDKHLDIIEKIYHLIKFLLFYRSSSVEHRYDKNQL